MFYLQEQKTWTPSLGNTPENDYPQVPLIYIHITWNLACTRTDYMIFKIYPPGTFAIVMITKSNVIVSREQSRTCNLSDTIVVNGIGYFCAAPHPYSWFDSNTLILFDLDFLIRFYSDSSIWFYSFCTRIFFIRVTFDSQPWEAHTWYSVLKII